MTQFGDRSNNNSPPVREQSWPTPSLLTPNEMRVFDPTHAGDSPHPHYTLPKYNTGLFPVYFIDCNYKADSKQSTIMQLTFQNLEIPQDYEGRNFTSQAGPKEPTPVLGLWGRMFHFPIDLSSMIRPGTGFPCWNALCSFFFFCMFCYVDMFLKKRFYVIIRQSVVKCTAVVIMTYFYIK